jgi:hypothetical protein
VCYYYKGSFDFGEVGGAQVNEHEI